MILCIRVIVHCSTKNVCRAISILTLTERVCFVNCNHQLGVVGSVWEYPHETGTNSLVGSRKNHREMGGDKEVDFSFWFGPRYSAMSSPTRVGTFTGQRERSQLLSNFFNLCLCGLRIHIRHGRTFCWCAGLLREALDEISTSLQKVVKSSHCRTIYPHLFIFFCEFSKEINPGSGPRRVVHIAHLVYPTHDARPVTASGVIV